MSSTLPSFQAPQSGPVQVQETTRPWALQGPQTLTSSTLPSFQANHSGPVQVQETTQPLATQGSQSLTSSTLPFSQAQQSGLLSGPETTEPVQSDLEEVSSLLAEFAGVEVNLKVTGTESKSGGVAEKATSAGSPGAIDPASGEPLTTLASSPQVQLSSKSDNLVHNPAKGIAHSGPPSGASTLEDASQKATELEFASTRDPLPAATDAAPTQHLDTNSHLAPTETGLRREAAPEADPVHPSGVSLSTCDGSTAHAKLSDQATDGEGKPGQQSGPSMAENSTANKPLSSELASHAALDSATSLLTAHPPESPASHAHTSTAQTLPPAGQPPATLAAWQNYEGSAGKIVKSAWLSDYAGGAEMHVELRSGTLGPLEIHAVVREGSVGAEIRVEGHESHTLLAAGLPSLERALGERNLRVENLAVYQDHGGGGMSGGERQNPHSSSSYSPQRQVVRWDTSSQPSRLPGGGVEIEEVGDVAVGLSVRA
jgi:hypothetical protein